jgi:hypothetical protein
MADAHGYYDGAAQKLACGLKTVCSNGTSGFLWSRRLKTSAVIALGPDGSPIPTTFQRSLIPAPSGDRRREDDADGEVLGTRALQGRLAYTEMFEEVSEIPVPMGDNVAPLAMDSGRATPPGQIIRHRVRPSR